MSVTVMSATRVSIYIRILMLLTTQQMWYGYVLIALGYYWDSSDVLFKMKKKIIKFISIMTIYLINILFICF